MTIYSDAYNDPNQLLEKDVITDVFNKIQQACTTAIRWRKTRCMEIIDVDRLKTPFKSYCGRNTHGSSICSTCQDNKLKHWIADIDEVKVNKRRRLS